MNAPITEKAVMAWLKPVLDDTPVILGASTDTRTTPSVRIVCTSCILPEAFEQADKERECVVILAVLESADEAGAAERGQEMIDAIQDRMGELKNEITTADSTDVLFHSAFLQDQATENENSDLLYGTTYQIFYAYNETT